jgi:DNA-binding MurR/RpiR family transcriptional regulator
MENSADIPFLSASELATRAGVSQPSVTRLAAALGFDGYGALREELRTQPPIQRADDNPTPDRWRRVVDAEIERLRRCRELLPGDRQWEELGAELMASTPVVVAGMRASRYLARYFSYLARKIHPDVVEISGDPDPLEAVAAARERGAKAALVVCMPRYPRATVELLGWLDHLGYRVLLVSDDAMPPLPGPGLASDRAGGHRTHLRQPPGRADRAAHARRSHVRRRTQEQRTTPRAARRHRGRRRHLLGP